MNRIAPIVLFVKGKMTIKNYLYTAQLGEQYIVFVYVYIYIYIYKYKFEKMYIQKKKN